MVALAVFASNLCGFLLTLRSRDIMLTPLLAMIALSAVRSSAKTFIHNAIVVIDTADNVDTISSLASQDAIFVDSC